ncbi:family 16 glycoside hydrolase [Nitrosophilus kaiyonis]|uniref:family 16 glycoside hydrolase n=1 Tax=Nitrosophilus kaiyonis TaxID=2930200 RepID=UPI0024906390|nr:family 16 glycoside hydrolase [Nitrosophilus kaiyonis]
MRKIFIFIILLTYIFGNEKNMKENFESTKVGNIPFGWIMSGYNQKSFGIWEVIDGKYLKMKYPRGSYKNQFNIFFTKDLYFKNGEVEVKIKTDQNFKNGGIIWRFRDKKNFYMALLKRDFLNIFVIKNSKSKNIFTKKIDIKNYWNNIKVRYLNNKIEIFLNNKKLISISDETLLIPGGVGLVTEADAKTIFDDIQIINFDKK